MYKESLILLFISNSTWSFCGLLSWIYEFTKILVHWLIYGLVHTMHGMMSRPCYGCIKTGRPSKQPNAQNLSCSAWQSCLASFICTDEVSSHILVPSLGLSVDAVINSLNWYHLWFLFVRHKCQNSHSALVHIVHIVLSVINLLIITAFIHLHCCIVSRN